MTSTKDQLFSANRARERAFDAFQNWLLTSARLDGTFFTESLRELYYTSSTLKSFLKRVDAAIKSIPTRPALASEIRSRVAPIVALWESAESLRLAEKARLADVRAKRAAKADQKADLDLGDGIDLKGVDVGQFKVLVAALEPVRAHVEKVVFDGIRRELDEIIAILPKLNRVANRRVTSPDERRLREWDVERLIGSFEHFGRLTRNVGDWAVQKFDALPDNQTYRYAKETAARRALDYVQGYAAKLSVKIGEEIAADGLGEPAIARVDVSSYDLWRHSIVVVSFTSGDVITFKTQTIWNTSSLGKRFNQWPTRRIKN